jgi:hypothetical protein
MVGNDQIRCEDDATYYRRRAESELEMAQRATRAEVVKVHYLLATAYLDRLEPDGSADAADDT